jgi:MYXO-CTERM domain-containing protein
MATPSRLSCSLLAGGFALLAPRLVSACGGTFCDGNTLTPMPVDQTGEDILFVREAGEIEVHIRIQYVGEAERFAWVLPLPAVPEVSVGSEPLFAALSGQLGPVWSTSLSFEDPSDNPNGCSPGGCLDLSDGGDPPPGVVFDEIIGAFEVVVLDVDTVEAVLEFFDQNGYAYDAGAAAPVIQTYIDEGSLIVGVKLTAGASVSEIHPLVFRFASDEPCIPLRLTRVAAREDMPVRAYFLGQQRWAPSNYLHVALNPLIYDWSSPSAGDYRELLTLAVDEAGGHAFATEFAGPSSELSTFGIWRQDWTSAGLASMDAHMAIEAMRAKELIVGDAINPHVLAALREFIPVPPAWGADEELFWLDHAEHPQLIDIIEFDAPGFAAMLDERLFEPAMHAVDLLDTWPYLTRLHTTISPVEMTLDPTFHETADLPMLSERRSTSALVLSGGDWTRYEIPWSGEDEPALAQLCGERGAAWPSFDDMPRALRIEQIPSMGPAQVMVDHQAELEQWAQSTYADSACEATGSGGGSESGDEGIGGDETGPGLGPTLDSRSGCACTSGEGGGGPLALLVPLLVLVPLRRR